MFSRSMHREDTGAWTGAVREVRGRGQAGFQLRGGGVDKAPWLDPPPPPNGAQLTGPPKSHGD